MLIACDEDERQKSLDERSLDFAGVRLIAFEMRKTMAKIAIAPQGYSKWLVVLVWTYRPDEINPTARLFQLQKPTNKRWKNLPSLSADDAPKLGDDFLSVLTCITDQALCMKPALHMRRLCVD